MQKTVLNLDENKKVIQKVNWEDKLETPCTFSDVNRHEIALIFRNFLYHQIRLETLFLMMYKS